VNPQSIGEGQEIMARLRSAISGWLNGEPRVLERDRSIIGLAASQAVEALERRFLLSASVTDPAGGQPMAPLPEQSAVLAAVPPTLQSRFVGSQLFLSASASRGAATPSYVLTDSNPVVTSDGKLSPFSSPGPAGLTPAQMRHPYGVDNIKFGAITGDGSGQTIAIIDAYDYPTAAADLYAFDQQFGLPDPPSFTKVNETGGTALPGTDPAGKGNDWELEEALDIEWAHAMAPGANIILVEANSPTDADLITNAVGWARSAPGVSAISMSFGQDEFPDEASLASIFTTPAGHTGVTFLASTGDGGAPGGFPAYSSNVVAVGGTTLNVDSSGNFLSETGWADGGGGISAYEAQPAYQQGVVTQTSSNRAIPDVALDADPHTGAAVYDSYDFGASSPWIQVGGTSLSSPAWAGLIAIANQGRANNGGAMLDGPTQTLPRLYSAPASDFHDITSGNNGFAAGPGYDLVTGQGSPVANLLVPYLAAAGPYVTSFAPAGIQSTPPSSFTFTFSTPMDPTSFSVATGVGAFTGPDNVDLGSSITGYSWSNNNTTLQVNFAAPAAQGPYTMTIGPQIRSAGGIPMDQNQNGVNAELPADQYSGTFYNDASPTGVAFTTPAAGATVTPPFTTLDVHFTSAIDPSTVAIDDLTLNQGSVTAATVLDAMTAEYTIAGITQAGTITVAMPQGAVSDANENPVLAFNATYQIPVPPAPGTPTLVAATDSGVSNSDDITNFDNSSPAKALQFSVPNTIAGDTIAIYADGTLIGSATATSSTTVVTTTGAAPLTYGIHSITARQGPVGGQGGDSAPLSVTILNAPLTLAAAGGLDRSFHGTGYSVNPALAGGGADSVVAQADGTMLVGGAAMQFGQGATSGVVARYTASGQLDTTFGTGGCAYVQLPDGGTGNMTARAIAVQADGKIVALITPANHPNWSNLYVARFNADGTPDPTFGSGGVATIFPGNTIAATSLAIQSDGKLVVSGSLPGGGGVLIRLTATGALDTNFGGGQGYIKANVGLFTAFDAVALTDDGHILALGSTSTGTDSYITLARFTASGELDTTFGGNGTGYAITSIPTSDTDGWGIAIQPDGKIVASAYVSDSNSFFGAAVLRYTPSGTLDGTFGAGGIVELTSLDVFSAPVLQSDGKIVIAGWHDTGNVNHGFVDRLNPDGSLDTTFGGTGQVVIALGPTSDYNSFSAVALQPDGRIVAVGVAGDAANPGTQDFAVARFFGATPVISLDSTSDTGVSNADRITNSSAPVFDVPNVSGLYTRIFRNGTLVSDPYLTSGTITPGAQPEGVDSYTFELVDAAGNPSPMSPAYTVTFDTTPPTANMAAGLAISSSAPGYTFTVTYTDSFDVAGASLAGGNILVTAPGGYSQPATLVSASLMGNANSIAATYQITPPAGGWGAAGTVYTLTFQGNSVSDLAGNAAPSTVLGTVSVIPIDPPGAPQLQSATDSGASSSDGLTRFNNSSAASALQFLVPNTTAGTTVTVYADGVAIGTATASGSSTVVTTSGAYTLANGAHVITARQTLNGAQTADSAPHSITIDTTPPTAAIVGPLLASGANYTFTVTYSDANGIDVSTLDGNDLRVSNFAGYSQFATLVSVSPATNGSPITATYQITPPSGGWPAGGTFSAAVQSAQVADIAGNFMPITSLSRLSLVPAASPGMPALAAAMDSGASSSDGITNFDNSTPAKALQFVVPANISNWVTIYIDGVAIDSAKATSNTVVITTDGATRLAPGPHTITARQAPAGTVQSADSPALTITIQTAAIAPAAPVLDPGSDSGINNSDGITNVALPTLDVTAGEAGTVYVQIDGPNGPVLSQTVTGPGVVQIPALVPGGLQSPLNFSTNLTAGAVAHNNVVAGDFNGDGKTDLVILGSAAQLFLGNGDGTFGAPIMIPGTAGAFDVHAADFNGDGKPDLWFGSYNGGSQFQVLLSNGDGTFGAAPLASGDIWTHTQFADINGDGKLDMIAMNGSGNTTFNVWLGNGDGTFQAPYTVNAGITVDNLQVGDLNGDGRPDVVIAMNLTFASPETLSVVLNTGNNTFAAPVLTTLSGDSVYALLTGDFNNDGKCDVFIADVDVNDVLLSNGDGTFQTPLTVSTGINPAFAVVGDFNHDGKLDAAVGAESGPGNSASDLFVLFGQGTGTFQPAMTYSTTSGWYAVAADLNGDGDADIATTTELTGNNVSVFLATGGPLQAGTHTLTAWETDLAGNVSSLSAAARITLDQTAPTASHFIGPALTTPATAPHTFTVTYGDNVAVNVASVNGNDILVTGPNGYSQLATFLSASPSTNGNSIVATYQIVPPPGEWTPAANGTYTVTLQASQVGDIAGNAAAAGAIGTFSISVTAVTLTAQGRNPSTATEPLTFTATITGGVPDGEAVSLVDASNGNAVVATGTLSGGSATLNVPAGALSIGTHTLIAGYGGDANFAASESAAYSQVVQVAPPSLVGAPVINGDNPNGLFTAPGQPRPGVQRSMVEDIVYTFDQPVTMLDANAAFTVVGIGAHAGSAPATLLATAVPGTNGTQWAVSLTGKANGVLASIANGEYSITLNPNAVFAAADGMTAMNTGHTDTFYRLFGDINGDRVVNVSDEFQFSKAMTTYTPIFDVNGDGAINLADEFQASKSFSSGGYVGDGFVTSI
jgi:uncharacterized delta-60 repeat protein